MSPRATSRTWIVAVFLLAALLPLWKCLAYGHTVGPYDQIAQMAPWNGPKPDRPWDVLQADGVLQFYGWRDQVFHAWASRQLPFWNPQVLGGTPLLANSQSGALYPLHALAGLLHLPTATAIFLLAWAHFAIATGGMALLVRRMGGNLAGSVLAGLSFGLSPFFLAWVALPSVVETVSWIPWILAGIAGWFRADTEGRSRLPDALFSGQGVAMLLLAGHLQFAAYGLMAAALFVVGYGVMALKRRFGEGGFKHLAQVIVLLTLGAGVAAVQVLPVLQFSQYSHRRNVASEEGYNAYAASALRPADFVSRLANPYGQGDPNQFVDPNAPFSTFWPAVSRPGANYAESALTVGPLVVMMIALGIGARTRRPGASLLVGLAVLSLLLAVGSPLGRLLYFFVPGWSSTGSPGRVICLFVLALCALAGLLFPDRWDALSPKRVAATLGAGFLFAVATLVPVIDATPNGMNADTWSALSAGGSTTAGVFLVSALIAAGGLLAITKRPSIQLPTAAALPIVVAVLLGAAQHVRTGDATFLSKNLIPVEPGTRVAVINQDWGLLQAGKALYPPNTNMPAGFTQIGGYDSLLHRESQAMLAEINGGDPAPPANGNMMFIKPTADPRKLGEAGVTEVWSLNPLGQFGDPIDTSSGFFRYRIPGPGFADTVAGPATVLRRDGPSISLKASGKGRLVVRERNMPGWSAQIDGKPTEIGNGRWIELNLEPGEHTVLLSYTAPGFYLGLLISVGCLLALVKLSLGFGSRLAKVESE